MRILSAAMKKRPDQQLLPSLLEKFNIQLAPIPLPELYCR